MSFRVGSIVKNLPANAIGASLISDSEIPWRRKWQPTTVFVPGEFHGQRSLAGHSSIVGHDLATKQGLKLGLHCSLSSPISTPGLVETRVLLRLVMRSQEAWQVAGLKLGCKGSQPLQNLSAEIPPHEASLEFSLVRCPSTLVPGQLGRASWTSGWCGSEKEGTRPRKVSEGDRSSARLGSRLLDAFGAATCAGRRGATCR